MRSFRKLTDDRQRIYLALAGSVERKLREAFMRSNDAGKATQSSLALKLGVNRSVVHRRLVGGENMTLKTIADMVWALGQCIEVDIFDPGSRPDRNDLVMGRDSLPAPPIRAENDWGDLSGGPKVEVQSRFEVADA